MTDKTEILSRIKEFANSSTVEATLAFLSTLGYNTSRRVNIPIDKENLGRPEIKNATLFMQLTDAEMSGAKSLFSAGKFEKQNIESYLFIAVDLVKPEYNRSTLARIIRDINKRFAIPVFVVFRHGMHITLSIIYRRIHKRDAQKDVLEKVTLIKDIDVREPHRGHIDVLCDLSLPKLRMQYPVTNFVELDKAWQKVLDTKELYVKFYKEISYWFHWAKTEAKFPGGRDEVNLLRLLTRIIFIWFIKEKKLVPDCLFRESIITDYLKNKDHYYNAILQNLFFGTLNCAIEDRKFRDERTFQGKNASYGVKTQYRYANSFKCCEKEAETLFASIPFLNSGLFDCLDTNTNETDKVEYVDGFSDNSKQQAVLPDKLFFSEKKQLDLNDKFGTKNKKYEVCGLFHTLARYKFTVAENTPLEEDIALDPELLGNVFENLLASYNPETRETARKRTGSFYTPREIVDYMVEQSLAHYPEKDWPGLKILDPTCGSGAFPMGVLNAMVDRLASDKSHAERYEFKKHIIENCLFGVDIQPIAVQITKLRFFISLICEQEKDETKENFGITALPNLETKFIAADTLIRLEEKEKHVTDPFGTPEIKKKQDELHKVRHDHFPSPARKRAEWNPYDQNAPSPFFDPEWMFGIKDGFDVVIGNPPYLKEGRISKAVFEQYNHLPYYQGKMDLWYMFACYGIDVLKSGGHLCFIATNNWITSSGASKLRNKVVLETQIKQLIDFGNFMIFENAGIQTMIMLLSKDRKTDNYKFDYCKMADDTTLADALDLLNKRENNKTTYLFPKISRNELKDKFLTFSSNDTTLDKIAGEGIYLLAEEIAQGVVPNPDAVNSRNIQKISHYKRDAFSIKVGDGVFVLSKSVTDTFPLSEQKYIKPLYKPTEIEKYCLSNSNERILYITKQNYKNDSPKIIEHLEKYKEIMDDRRENLNGRLNFFHLHWPRDSTFFETGSKILSIRKCNKPTFAYTENDAYVMMAINVIKTNRFNLKYLVGLLNSTLIAFWLKNKGKMQGENYQVDKEPLLQIPIRVARKERARPIIRLVERILSAKQANLQSDTNELECEIDALVFHLYGLSEEEMMSVLLSQDESEIDRRRIQAFYKNYEKKDKK